MFIIRKRNKRVSTINKGGGEMGKAVFACIWFLISCSVIIERGNKKRGDSYMIRNGDRKKKEDYT